jgi:hypothetical protein
MSGARRYTTEEIIAALKETNGLISLAAKRLRCVPQTIYTRAQRVQSVRQTIDDCREEMVDYAELALRASVTNKEPWAVSLVLKTLGKKRGYVERIEQEHSGPGGGAIELKWANGDEVTDPTHGSA